MASTDMSHSPFNSSVSLDWRRNQGTTSTTAIIIIIITNNLDMFRVTTWRGQPGDGDTSYIKASLLYTNYNLYHNHQVCQYWLRLRNYNGVKYLRTNRLVILLVCRPFPKHAIQRLVNQMLWDTPDDFLCILLHILAVFLDLLVIIASSTFCQVQRHTKHGHHSQAHMSLLCRMRGSRRKSRE